MVKEELEVRGIENPRILEAFRKVPRENFIPPESQDLAYFDGVECPIAYWYNGAMLYN